MRTKKIGVLYTSLGETIRKPFGFYCLNHDNSIQLFKNEPIELWTTIYPPPSAQEIVQVFYID